jgi:hypothetical protein
MEKKKKNTYVDKKNVSSHYSGGVFRKKIVGLT